MTTPNHREEVEGRGKELGKEMNKGKGGGEEWRGRRGGEGRRGKEWRVGYGRRGREREREGGERAR